MFLQDSAPAHRVKNTLSWFESQKIDLISPSEWPPYSPDLNPMDYSIWSILESKACAARHDNFEKLKTSLLKAWDELTPETLTKICQNFRHRLRSCINSKGGHF